MFLILTDYYFFIKLFFQGGAIVCNQDMVFSFLVMWSFTDGFESAFVGFICTVLVTMVARQSYSTIQNREST